MIIYNIRELKYFKNSISSNSLIFQLYGLIGLLLEIALWLIYNEDLYRKIFAEIVFIILTLIFSIIIYVIIQKRIKNKKNTSLYEPPFPYSLRIYPIAAVLIFYVINSVAVRKYVQNNINFRLIGYTGILFFYFNAIFFFIEYYGHKNRKIFIEIKNNKLYLTKFYPFFFYPQTYHYELHSKPGILYLILGRTKNNFLRKIDGKYIIDLCSIGRILKNKNELFFIYGITSSETNKFSAILLSSLLSFAEFENIISVISQYYDIEWIRPAKNIRDDTINPVPLNLTQTEWNKLAF